MTFAQQSESSQWMTRRYALALTVIALLACSAYAALTLVKPFETAVGGNHPRRGRVVTINDTSHLEGMPTDSE